MKLKLYVDTTLTKDQKEIIKLKSNELNSDAQLIRMKFISENTSSWAALSLMKDMLIRSQLRMEDVAKLLPLVDKKYHNFADYKSEKHITTDLLPQK